MDQKISRRSVVKLGALLSSLSLFPSNLFGLNWANNKTGFQTEDIYHFKVGDFKCICLKDSDGSYPHEAFFQHVPKEAVEEALRGLGVPTDKVYTPFTHLLVDTGKNKILVDTGWGKNLAKNMKLAGVDPSEIDTVLITHAHPDHIGGILDENGAIVYSNAHYYIWKGEWDFWFSEEAFAIAKEGHIKTARAKLSPVRDRVTFLEKDAELFDGIKVIATPGHTPGHVIYSFSSNKEIVYYTGDVVLFPLHLEHPDWLPVYDLVPDKAAISKNTTFNMLAESKAPMIGQQFVPFPSLGHIVKKETGWKFEPMVKA